LVILLIPQTDKTLELIFVVIATNLVKSVIKLSGFLEIPVRLLQILFTVLMLVPPNIFEGVADAEAIYWSWSKRKLHGFNTLDRCALLVV
jgi:hypothetical protein